MTTRATGELASVVLRTERHPNPISKTRSLPPSHRSTVNPMNERQQMINAKALQQNRYYLNFMNLTRGEDARNTHHDTNSPFIDRMVCMGLYFLTNPATFPRNTSRVCPSDVTQRQSNNRPTNNLIVIAIKAS